MSNKGIKVTKISIEKFRRFHEVGFDIGHCVTLIAGQNATSKSTLLGMLCQPFSFGAKQGKKSRLKDNSKYTDNYHGINLAEHKDLTGNAFLYDCEDVFRLSNVHDTIPNKYSYRLRLSGNCITKDSPIYEGGLLVRAQHRPDKKRIRFVAGPKASSEAGEGNFPHPVIYFGLNRLWPLALIKGMKTVKHPEIDDSDNEWYIEKYKQILLLDEDTNKAEFITADKSTKKDFVGVSGKDYNSESFSAGQDNLGQILTAVLSFKRLKSKLGDKYQGGMILIDEIDSTLHPDAQLQLMKILCEEAAKYQLQIIATTHSLYLLRHAFHSKLKKNIKVIYLKREGDHVVDSCFTTYDEIEKNLQVEAEAMPRNKTKKVSLIFEDKVGKDMFFAIIGNTLNQYFHRFQMDSLSAGTLSNLASLSSRVPELEKIILIPDGDVKANTKKSKNLVFLPGELRPETLLHECLKNLPEADLFWSECPATGYSKQVAILKQETTPTVPNERKKWYKNWYKKQSKFWGRSSKIAFSKWANNNKELCKQFCQEFFKILKQVSPEALPKAKIDDILERYL